MTAREFIAKWQASTLKERSASQSHFNDLCALIGQLSPVAAGLADAEVLGRLLALTRERSQ